MSNPEWQFHLTALKLVSRVNLYKGGKKIHQDTDFYHSYLKLESGISETAYQLTMAETSVYKARQVSNHLFCSGNVTSTASKV